MSFLDNLKRGFSKIGLKIAQFREQRARQAQIVSEQNLREAEIREKVRPEAEKAYWDEKEKVIKEEEISKAKQAARPKPIQQSYSKPLIQPPAISKGLLSGGFNQPPLSNQGNGMADYDFLGTKGNKKQGKEKTIGDMIKY